MYSEARYTHIYIYHIYDIGRNVLKYTAGNVLTVTEINSKLLSYSRILL